MGVNFLPSRCGILGYFEVEFSIIHSFFIPSPSCTYCHYSDALKVLVGDFRLCSSGERQAHRRHDQYCQRKRREYGGTRVAYHLRVPRAALYRSTTGGTQECVRYALTDGGRSRPCVKIANMARNALGGALPHARARTPIHAQRQQRAE